MCSASLNEDHPSVFLINYLKSGLQLPGIDGNNGEDLAIMAGLQATGRGRRGDLDHYTAGQSLDNNGLRGCLADTKKHT